MTPIDQSTYSTLTVSAPAPKVSFFGPPGGDSGPGGGDSGPGGGSMGAENVTPNPQN